MPFLSALSFLNISESPTLRRGLGYGHLYIGRVSEHRSLNSALANLFWGL